MGNRKYLFEEKNRHGKSGRRAIGAGPKPIEPTRTVDPEIGSEGIITFLITELCRERKKKFYSHPGPNQIRKEKIHNFFLITDFIGSGKRVAAYLDAAWRIRSIKSWASINISKRNNDKLINFQVIAYSSSDKGHKKVLGHPSLPKVSVVTGCPTIKTEFNACDAQKIIDLCFRYSVSPKTLAADWESDNDDSSPLGYGHVGALMVFFHKCPNNSPRILHSSAKGWKPLFPSGVPARSRKIFKDLEDDKVFASRLKNLKEIRLLRNGAFPVLKREGQQLLLVLSALQKGPRFDEVVSRKTGVTTIEIQELVKIMLKWGWLTEERRITDKGRKVLSHARQQKVKKVAVSFSQKVPYYPKSLRIPS